MMFSSIVLHIRLIGLFNSIYAIFNYVYVISFMPQISHNGDDSLSIRSKYFLVFSCSVLSLEMDFISFEFNAD